ncbi:FaeA-like protein [Serratia fonticola]|jgi:predicted transcriptional regulator|uniref:FaeA-like protein n=1 Tax=Serratia fonticola TaxID=47917 RepID=A0A559T1D0_SERFO|nr:FaeA/PapI family transcriptional regulator [Serratia fonticola]TQI79107.1 FaeA-like protein [Serratia fonticola]TQI98869.1 FaeA-like protein [Serratia fonticola]TVZ68395.1 FaeA-like protein [Serratia fonticola]
MKEKLETVFYGKNQSPLEKTAEMKRVMTLILQFLREQGEEGVTTRQVSNACDLSIYSSRNWLIKLESVGLIYNRKQSERKSKWFISTS